ncbi:hypothetical protein GCM10010129_77980 [Streptomyces fumigatiscleroticus]|nr:hypothetical protein GCM10010129_77980 [Streptomyces fumigatiscleroticus]
MRRLLAASLLALGIAVAGVTATTAAAQPDTHQNLAGYCEGCAGW